MNHNSFWQCDALHVPPRKKISFFLWNKPVSASNQRKVIPKLRFKSKISPCNISWEFNENVCIRPKNVKFFFGPGSNPPQGSWNPAWFFVCNCADKWQHNPFGKTKHVRFPINMTIKLGHLDKIKTCLSLPVVAEVGHNVVHDINQQWYDPLLLVTVEHHVQQMSQHLTY